MNNILTFDIEEWYEANYKGINFTTIDYQQSNLLDEVEEILNLCEKYQAKATFFILGKVAEKNPYLVKLIQGKGQEIASHGYEHKLVYNLSPKEFEEDLQKSIKILESITGERVLGYRAPSWSVTRETSWVYPILAKLGIKYSASVFPIKTFLYGWPDSPRFPYLKEIDDKKILEIPASTLKIFGKNIPFSGGTFFRLLPYWLVELGIKKNNRESQPAIIYLHPREIDPKAPKLSLPWKEHLIHYWGVAQTKQKLEKLLKEFRFSSIKLGLLPFFDL